MYQYPTLARLLFMLVGRRTFTLWLHLFLKSLTQSLPGRSLFHLELVVDIGYGMVLYLGNGT
jgi:hypothetical protein